MIDARRDIRQGQFTVRDANIAAVGVRRSETLRVLAQHPIATAEKPHMHVVATVSELKPFEVLRRAVGRILRT